MGSIIVVILIGLAFWAGFYYQNKIKVAKSKVINQQKTSAIEVTKPVVKAPNDWKTFENSAQKYSFRSPAGTSILNADTTEKQKQPAKLSNCVKITVKNATIVIAGKFIDDNTPCLRNDLGNGWQDAPREKIMIGQIDYEVSGIKKELASTGYYEDYYRVNLVSGEEIEYSVLVNKQYNNLDDIDQAKNLVHQILENFSVIK